MYRSTDTDCDDPDNDNDYPTLMAIKEQVQRMDQWLDDVIQPLRFAEENQQQQQQQAQEGGGGRIVRWYDDDDYDDYDYDYDDDDSDQDGIEEECFALQYYSERKLRHDLQMVDLILIPALSLSRPWMKHKDIHQDLNGWPASCSESFQIPMQHQHRSLMSPVPVPVTLIPNEQLRNDGVEYGPTLPLRPIRIGTATSNLSFDSTLTTPEASSSSCRRSARPHDSHECPPCTNQRISSIQQSNLPQEHNGTHRLLPERKTVDHLLGHPAQDTTFSQCHGQSYLPRLPSVSTSSNNVVIPNKQNEQGRGLDPLPVLGTVFKANNGDHAAQGTRLRQHSLTIDTDWGDESKHGITTPSHAVISPWHASEKQESSANSCSNFIPNQSKSWQGKRDRDHITTVLLSTMSSSKNALHDKPRNHKSNNGPPALTSLDSNASSLSAITTCTEMAQGKSCPWSGIVIPPPSSSHHGSKPKIVPTHCPLVPNTSSLSLSSSPSIAKTSRRRRNIFLENLNLRLGDIDKQLQADTSIPENITAEEILEDLESQLEVYWDLETIKTQLLVEAKAELDSVVVGGASVHSRVNGLPSRPEVDVHHHHHHHQEGISVVSTTPTSSMPSPELAMDEILDTFHHRDDDYFLDRQQVCKAKSTKDTAVMSPPSPNAIYPQDGETDPTALSTLSLESSEDPNYNASWEDMGNGILSSEATSTPDIQVEDQNEISETWHEIGNLISSNIQECVDQRERWTLERHTNNKTGDGTANKNYHPVDQPPANDNHDTKEDYRDTILHALARIYARIYLRPLPGMRRPHDKYPPEPTLPETGTGCYPTTTRHDMTEDEKVEEAIHRISLRVQLGALKHMEARWQKQSDVERATWQKHIQDHLSRQDETKQVDKVDRNGNNHIMDDWLGNLISSHE